MNMLRMDKQTTVNRVVKATVVMVVALASMNVA